MASEEKIEKPAWMFYFDGPFYDNYLNDLRRLNISQIQNNLKETNNKNRPSILKHTNSPTLFEPGQYMPNGIKEIQSLSNSELEWRKRRTNGLVVIAILLIAGIATATALVMHLVFIEGKDPFEIPDLSDDSLHRRRTTTTILPIVTNTEDSPVGHDDVTTQKNLKDFSTPTHHITTSSEKKPSEKDINIKTEKNDNVLTKKTISIEETSPNPSSIESHVTEYYIHPGSSTDGSTQIPAKYKENEITASSAKYDNTDVTTSSSQYYKTDDTTLSSLGNRSTLTRLYENTDSRTLSSDMHLSTTTSIKHETESTTRYYKTYTTTIKSTSSVYLDHTITSGPKLDSTTISSVGPESTTLSSVGHDSTTASTVRPNSTTTSSVRPDSTTTSTARPDSTTTSTFKPDSTTTSTVRPDDTTTSTVRPDSTTTSSVGPDSTTTINAGPDSTTTSSARPDSTTTSTVRSDRTTKRSVRHESSTTNSVKSKSTTTSNVRPESATTNNVKTDSTATSSVKYDSTTTSSVKYDSTTISSYETNGTTSSSGKPVITTLSSDKSEITTITSDKNISNTNLSSQNNNIDDVIMTHSTNLPNEYTDKLLENTVTTTAPHSTTDKNLNKEAFNFIILDKAGTTLDVASGTVISAEDSPHTINNTDVIITTGIETPRQQAQIQVVPETSTASVDLNDPEVFCKHYPADMMIDPTNCARYYNCSDPSIKQGLEVKYLRECRYPRLFKDVKTGCVIFLNVTCANRYEPKAPCEYIENMCFGDSCGSCEDRLPSCVGRENGTIEYSKGEDGSTKYIACFKERTVGQMTCKSGTYDRKSKKCVDSV